MLSVIHRYGNTSYQQDYNPNYCHHNYGYCDSCILFSAGMLFLRFCSGSCPDSAKIARNLSCVSSLQMAISLSIKKFVISPATPSEAEIICRWVMMNDSPSFG